jgi:hypothetical protein
MWTSVSPWVQAWLKRLNIFPDQDTFHRLWTKYDPHGAGFIGYQAGAYTRQLLTTT